MTIEPLVGAVKIDGADIRDYTLKSLRDQISFVLQDSLLFRGTIWENIAYGKPDAEIEDTVHAGVIVNDDRVGGRGDGVPRAGGRAQTSIRVGSCAAVGECAMAAPIAAALPLLETPRLRLRAYRADDAEAASGRVTA